LIFIGGGYFAVFTLRSKDENDNMGWIKEFIGLILLFFLLALLGNWASYCRLQGIPLVLFMHKDLIRKVFNRKKP